MLFGVAMGFAGTPIANRRMNRAGYPIARRWAWNVAVPAMLAVAVLQCMNAADAVIASGPGAYYVSVVVMIGLAAMNFLQFISFPHD